MKTATPPQRDNRSVSLRCINLRNTVMIAFLVRNFDKLPEHPGVGIHNQLKEKTIIDLIVILGCPNRIIRAARKIQILFLFGYNLYWQCVEKRKTAFVGALWNSDDPSVFEKSCCGKPGNIVHEQFPSIPDFKELSSCFPEKNSTKKRVVCLAPKIIRKR
jgi:hypothetical protein